MKNRIETAKRLLKLADSLISGASPLSNIKKHEAYDKVYNKIKSAVEEQFDIKLPKTPTDVTQHPHDRSQTCTGFKFVATSFVPKKSKEVIKAIRKAVPSKYEVILGGGGYPYVFVVKC